MDRVIFDKLDVVITSRIQYSRLISRATILFSKCSQVTKSDWWMFWRREAMKDVGRLRKAAVSCQPGYDPRISESGNGPRQYLGIHG